MIPTTLVKNLLLFLYPEIRTKFPTMVTRSIFGFCLQQVAHYFKGITKSTDFYKGIFLYVDPVDVIVPRQFYDNT